MSPQLASEIQTEQNHGRQKHGRGPDDLEHDDEHDFEAWHTFIQSHNYRASIATPMERRAHLVKVAGLAVSAIEAFDRNSSPLYNSTL